MKKRTNRRASLPCVIPQNIRILFCLLAAALLAILGIVASTYSARVRPINNEPNIPLLTGWTYRINDSAPSAIELPAHLKEPTDHTVILHNRLPKNQILGATLLLRTSQQTIQVYIEDTLLYECDAKIDGQLIPTNSYHFVRLPADYMGKEISIALQSPHSTYSRLLNEIFIGSKASHIFYIVTTMGLRFLVGLILSFVGTILVLCFLFFTKEHIKTASFVFLGGFFMSAGFWVMAESRILQFFFSNTTTVTCLSVFFLTLAPIFLGMYYNNSYAVRLRKMIRGLILLLCVLSAFMAVCSIINVLLPVALLPFYCVFMGIYLVIILISIILEFRRGERELLSTVIGLTSFALFALIDATAYLLNITIYKGNYFMIGLFFFCVMMMVDLIRSIDRMYQDAVKVNMLTTLAYSDSLTGLENRSAFLGKLSKISPETRPFVSMVVFDVNGLKQVNDTKGHLAGDALLRHSAKVLQSLFRAQDFVYRIGGDEFVAILFHARTLDLTSLERRLLEHLEKENVELASASYYLSIACGYATFDVTLDSDLFSTFNRADAKMYECKKLQKAALQKKTESN